MSTVKLTELPIISHLDSNTSNVILIGVDLPTDVTAQFTVKTLSEGLYANNILNVGNNEILFPGVIGQFVGNNETYLQLNLQNNNGNGSSDYVATADVGTDTTNYIDLGIAGSNNYTAGYSSITPLDGYLYVQGNTGQPGGNLIIGTNEPNRDVIISIGGMNSENVFARFSTTSGFKLINKPITFADGTTQNTSAVDGIQSSGSYANSAFLKANAAFLVANTPTHVANSAATYANGAFIQANAAFLRANTPDAIANSSALYANGAFTQANAAFLVANTPPHIANSAATYANGAFTQANAAFLVANTPTHVANSAALYANGAFAKANAALANTSGTFAGNLSITGNLNLLNGSLSSAGNMSVNGTMVLANSNFLATESAITIKATANVATPSNDGYMLHISGKQNVASRIVFDSYSVTGNAYAVVAGRTARGTVDAPLAAANGDILMRISGNGHGGANAGFTQFGVARIDIVATENYSTTNRGSQIQFWNCPVGSNTLQRIASFNGDSVSFTGVLEPQKGFVYTPRNLGAQTAITIDFANDSMIRATYSSTLTVSFSNYTYGKIVEVWVTNTAGTGQTINLGVLANNSTTGSTTLSVASNRSAKLQYFSIDGDLANTFCAITYA